MFTYFSFLNRGNKGSEERSVIPEHGIGTTTEVSVKITSHCASGGPCFIASETSSNSSPSTKTDRCDSSCGVVQTTGYRRPTRMSTSRKRSHNHDNGVNAPTNQDSAEPPAKKAVSQVCALYTRYNNVNFKIWTTSFLLAKHVDSEFAFLLPRSKCCHLIV